MSRNFAIIDSSVENSSRLRILPLGLRFSFFRGLLLLLLLLSWWLFLKKIIAAPFYQYFEPARCVVPLIDVIIMTALPGELEVVDFFLVDSAFLYKHNFGTMSFFTTMRNWLDVLRQKASIGTFSCPKLFLWHRVLPQSYGKDLQLKCCKGLMDMMPVQ